MADAEKTDIQKSRFVVYYGTERMVAQMEKRYAMEDFLAIMETLRGDNGCPWDKAQTHESLKQYFLEEAYEVAEAIDTGDPENLCEELGDVLLQVVFHARIAEEAGLFTMEDVIQGISEKMVHRHPHIFGDALADTPEAVSLNWEELKKREKHQTSQSQVLRAVPKAMPALMRAAKVQAKAGVSAENEVQALPKTLEAFLSQVSDCGLTEADFGNFLLRMVNISRFFQLNAELALTKATEQFINKFENAEKTAVSQAVSAPPSRGR